MNDYLLSNTDAYLPEDLAGELNAPRRAAHGTLGGFALLLAPFVFAIGGGLDLTKGLNVVVKLTGYLVFVSFIVWALRAKISPGREVILHGLFIVWCAIGLPAAVNRTATTSAILTLVQILVLFLILSSYTTNKKRLAFVLLMFICGALFTCFDSSSRGEILEAQQTGARAASYAANPNSFGYLLLLSSMGLAILWHSVHNKVIKIIFIAGFFFLMAFNMFTGSRKAIIVMVLFFLIWFYVCFIKDVKKNPLIPVYIGLILILGAFFFIHIFSMTSAASVRFEKSLAELQGHGRSGGLQDRWILVSEGLKIAANNPVFGVGLFGVASTIGLMSHTDYVEVLASTGILGFILYFSIFFSVWTRVRYVIAHTNNEQIKKITQTVQVALFCIMLIAVGRTNWNTKSTWLMMGAFLGWSMSQQNRLRREQLEAISYEDFEDDEGSDVPSEDSTDTEGVDQDPQDDADSSQGALPGYPV